MKKIYGFVLVSLLASASMICAMEEYPAIPHAASDNNGSPASPTRKQPVVSFPEEKAISHDLLSTTPASVSSERLLALRKSFIEPYKQRGQTRNSQPAEGRFFSTDPTCDDAIRVLILGLTVDDRQGDPNFNSVADIIDFMYHRKVTPAFRQEHLEELAQGLKTKPTAKEQTPYLEEQLFLLLRARVKKLTHGPHTTP